MSQVLVVDTNRKPLAPCHPAVARKLLTLGKAAVLRRSPFTIILRQAVEEVASLPLRLKLDPGSQTTGLAVVNDATGEVVFAAEGASRPADQSQVGVTASGAAQPEAKKNQI